MSVRCVLGWLVWDFRWMDGVVYMFKRVVCYYYNQVLCLYITGMNATFCNDSDYINRHLSGTLDYHQVTTATAPMNTKSIVCAVKHAVVPEVSTTLATLDGAAVSSSAISIVGGNVGSAIKPMRVGTNVEEAVVGDGVGASVPIMAGIGAAVVGANVGATDGGTGL